MKWFGVWRLCCSWAPVSDRQKYAAPSRMRLAAAPIIPRAATLRRGGSLFWRQHGDKHENRRGLCRVVERKRGRQTGRQSCARAVSSAVASIHPAMSVLSDRSEGSRGSDRRNSSGVPMHGKRSGERSRDAIITCVCTVWRTGGWSMRGWRCITLSQLRSARTWRWRITT